MPVLTVVAFVAMVAAVAGIVLMRRRLSQLQGILGSVESAVGATSADRDLVRAAQETASSRDRAVEEVIRYVSALDDASVGVMILSGPGSVEYTNRSSDSLLDNVQEKAVLWSRIEALAQRVSTSREAEVIEVDVHNPDRRVLQLTCAPVLAKDGTAHGVTLYIEDLSAKRRVDAMRTDFVANASHELKTPLGALALLAETLADAQDDALRLRLAGRLQTEANRLANVVDDVLQLAETESLGGEHALVSVREVVFAAVSDVDSFASNKDITFVDDGVAEVSVSADREQLLSAIRNLLYNGVTYTAVKGEPGVVRYRCSVEAGFACVEVEDTGIGIAERYQSRVFERFFRVDRARSRESGGTGLGLSIVRNVALAHGGSVSLNSKLGEGSTFKLCLPAVTEAPT